jgi:arylsulfatase A-like enzyme
MFDPDYRGSLTARDFATSLEIHADMDRRDLEHVIALYDGEIRYTDEYLGRLIERLRAMELLDDTIVAVTSDHGDEFFEHGKKGHGNHLYDETVLVPLVLRHPATIPAGTVVEQQARLMDVAPTLLALAGVAPPPGFGAMAGASHTARDLSSRWRTAGRETAPPAFGELRGEWASVRTEGAKLIRYLGPEARRLSRRRRAAAMQAQLAEMERAHVPSASLQRALVADLQTEDKLFDLGADPREQSPLADRPELRQRLLEEIEAWRKEWSAEPNLSTETAIDPAVRERLRKLGYL